MVDEHNEHSIGKLARTLSVALSPGPLSQLFNVLRATLKSWESEPGDKAS